MGGNFITFILVIVVRYTEERRRIGTGGGYQISAVYVHAPDVLNMYDFFCVSLSRVRIFCRTLGSLLSGLGLRGCGGCHVADGAGDVDLDGG